MSSSKQAKQAKQAAPPPDVHCRRFGLVEYDPTTGLVIIDGQCAVYASDIQAVWMDTSSGAAVIKLNNSTPEIRLASFYAALVVTHVSDMLRRIFETGREMCQICGQPCLAPRGAK